MFLILIKAITSRQQTLYISALAKKVLCAITLIMKAERAWINERRIKSILKFNTLSLSTRWFYFRHESAKGFVVSTQGIDWNANWIYDEKKRLRSSSLSERSTNFQASRVQFFHKSSTVQSVSSNKNLLIASLKAFHECLKGNLFDCEAYGEKELKCFIIICWTIYEILNRKCLNLVERSCWKSCERKMAF